MTTVDEYIAAADEERRPTLEALRALVREAAPDAQEEIRHGMPYYGLHGDLVAFAAQKRYFSFYVMSGGATVAPYREALGKLDCGKGCIRFRSLDQVPDGVLHDLVLAAARANQEQAGLNAAVPG